MSVKSVAQESEMLIFERSDNNRHSSSLAPDIDADKVFGIYTRLPEREEVVIPVEERLIVELYSK